MVPKIAAVVYALILFQLGRIKATECSWNDFHNQHCKISESDIQVRTSYQDGALLRVADGTFTVDLVGNDSRPKTLYAEDKGIVNVNGGFATIPSLEYLSLENNLINSIEGSVFKGLPQLVYLSLARNNISYLVEDSFAGLSKLEVLNLKHNALTKMSFSISYSTLPVLRELHLQHNGITYIDLDNEQNILMCDSNLRQLYLSNNSLWIFNVHSSCLKNLSHLFLEENSLTNFNIGHMPLEALSLDGNRLTTIPTVNKELKFLSLARNGVQYIDNILGTTNIAHLILSHNYISDSLTYYEKFQNISTLEHLALDHNQIISIPDGFLSNLSSLWSLDLTHNQISHISPTAFARLPSLLELSLKNNQLSSFPGKECFGQSNLNYLDLSNNKVENVSDIQANMIPNLKVLQLAGNPLKRIEPHSVSTDVEILL